MDVGLGDVVGVGSVWDAGWHIGVELCLWEGGGSVYVVWWMGDFCGRVRGLVCVVCWGW